MYLKLKWTCSCLLSTGVKHLHAYFICRVGYLLLILHIWLLYDDPSFLLNSLRHKWQRSRKVQGASQHGWCCLPVWRWAIPPLTTMRDFFFKAKRVVGKMQTYIYAYWPGQPFSYDTYWNQTKFTVQKICFPCEICMTSSRDVGHAE